MSQAFVIAFKVRPTENSIMPPDMGAAYVSCFATGETVEMAAEKAVNHLASDGLYPEDLVSAHLLDISDWEQYKGDKWPEQASRLISQQGFEEAMAAGQVVYGPFGGYSG
ncbi:hypothetical protein [Pseudomonas nitroreducens]|uniref:hypothetical protein n=1 Tax=Pseudomonas nitroreducens TaxID=46680 RepID=UPI003D28480E